MLRKRRGRRKWEVLKTWDTGRIAELDSAIDAEVLFLATDRMEESGMVEWPAARSATKTNG